MSIVFSTALTVISDNWDVFIAVVARKNLINQLQYIEDAELYTVFVIDEMLVHVCKIWKGTLPDGVLRTYSQENNDTARSAFENNYKNNANLSVVPRSYDGRIKTQPVTVDAGQWHNWHGISDSEDTLRAGVILAARIWWETIDSVRTQRYQLINLDQTLTAPANVTGDTLKVRWSYRDPVWLAGGRLRYVGAQFGDAVSMRVIAPAAALTPNENTTGNCGIVSGTVIPAAGNGTYDIDLTLSAPVPAPQENGYWDYALPVSTMMGRGTTTVSSTPGEAGYHIFENDFPVVEFISHDGMLGDAENVYDPQNINASLCLPEYCFECEIFKPDPGNDNPLEVVWRVLSTRYWTTV